MLYSFIIMAELILFPVVLMAAFIYIMLYPLIALLRALLECFIGALSALIRACRTRHPYQWRERQSRSFLLPKTRKSRGKRRH